MEMVIGKNITLGVCIIIGFILMGNINSGVDGAEKEIPATKFGQNVGGPTMTFLYW